METAIKHFLLGLTGFPLGHSRSPVLHSAALKDVGMKGEYRLFPVSPTAVGKDSLSALLERVRNQEIHGLNVTIPHKQTILPYLDKLTDTAASIGAVNTIYLTAEGLTGHNTDAEGFRLDLQRQFALEPGRALVLGAGGSARAVVHALQGDGWDIGVAARRTTQAYSLNVNQIFPLPFTAEKLEAFQPRLIVNTTPLGMSPDIDSSPWPADVPLPDKACIYDLVYNPEHTRLIKSAAAIGLRTAGGIGMLIEQAALSFEIWTGRQPNRSAMHAALKN